MQARQLEGFLSEFAYKDSIDEVWIYFEANRTKTMEWVADCELLGEGAQNGQGVIKLRLYA
jgi:hypothetical protein